jgi:hypothetical protein
MDATAPIVYLFRKGDPKNGEAIDGLEQYGVTWKNKGHYREVTFPEGSTKQQGISDGEFDCTHVTLPKGLVVNLSTVSDVSSLIVFDFDVKESQDLPQVLQILNRDGSGGLAKC